MDELKEARNHAIKNYCLVMNESLGLHWNTVPINQTLIQDRHSIAY